MGASASKTASGGSLAGAYMPSTTPLPKDWIFSTPPKPHIVEVRVPHNHPPGATTMLVNISANKVMDVRIPPGVQGGETFEISVLPTHPMEQIITTALPFVPGMTVVQTKPIVYGSVSLSYRAFSSDQQSMASYVGKLLQDALTKLTAQVWKMGCNACLGVQFNVTNDSSGKWGNFKIVIVTACGTPCILLSTSSPNSSSSTADIGTDDHAVMAPRLPDQIYVAPARQDDSMQQNANLDDDELAECSRWCGAAI